METKKPLGEMTLDELAAALKGRHPVEVGQWMKQQNPTDEQVLALEILYGHALAVQRARSSLRRMRSGS